MKRILTLTALAALATGPAFAGATCSTSPASAFQPQSVLTDQLTKDGLTVRKVKTENGCYEVYAIDKDGNQVNAAYNAETLEPVDNAEAGEG